MVVLDSFSDIAKKARPYENAVNSDYIWGRAPEKPTRNPLKISEKRLRNVDLHFQWILMPFWLHFGGFGAPFWKPRGLGKVIENVDAFVDAFRGALELQSAPPGAPKGR